MAALKDILNYKPVALQFGTSGLRGLVTDMTDLECYINTRGFLEFLIERAALTAGDTVHVGGDLRSSTPRIIAAVNKAIADTNLSFNYCGLLPTPALANYSIPKKQAAIMVTGSHIPEDRNGIKFYKPDGEVLKTDEAAIKDTVDNVRKSVYNSTEGLFDQSGMLTGTSASLSPDEQAIAEFKERFTNILPQYLEGKHIVVYQHSAVGRDLLAELLEIFGAQVTTVGRSDSFISIDTENVTPANETYFKKLAQDYDDGCFAIVSTDGDSDRPFVIDENGLFHRGDEVGYVVARQLGADFAAIPVSSSDAVDQSLTATGIEWKHTKIGSPYVIEVMQAAIAAGKSSVVGWEVNGGFLVGSNIALQDSILSPLATRDAFLPIFMVLKAAVDADCPVSDLFSKLPRRFTGAGLINDFSQKNSAKIISVLSRKDTAASRIIGEVFTQSKGFSGVKEIITIDGVRIIFKNGDIAHIRPSGNAPQLRIYAVADTQARANEIVALGIAEEGLLRSLEELTSSS